MRVIHMTYKGRAVCGRSRLLRWLDTFGWRHELPTLCKRCIDGIHGLGAEDRPPMSQRIAEATQVSRIMHRFGVPMFHAMSLAAIRWN